MQGDLHLPLEVAHDTELVYVKMENQPLGSNQPLQKLPNATAVLVLGICSIVFGCFLVGFICAIIGLAMSKKPMTMYAQNPQLYMNYGALNAGRILSIIGVILGAISVLWLLVGGVLLGGSYFFFEDLMDLVYDL